MKLTNLLRSARKDATYRHDRPSYDSRHHTFTCSSLPQARGHRDRHELSHSIETIHSNTSSFSIFSHLRLCVEAGLGAKAYRSSLMENPSPSCSESRSEMARCSQRLTYMTSIPAAGSTRLANLRRPAFGGIQGTWVIRKTKELGPEPKTPRPRVVTVSALKGHQLLFRSQPVLFG